MITASTFLTIGAIFAQSRLAFAASSSSDAPQAANIDAKSQNIRTITIHFDKDVQVCTNVCLSICNDGDKHEKDGRKRNADHPSNLTDDKSMSSVTFADPNETENDYEVISNMPKNFRIASGLIREVEGSDDRMSQFTSSEERPNGPISEKLILQDEPSTESPTTTTPVPTTTSPTTSDSTETTTSAETTTTSASSDPTTTVMNASSTEQTEISSEASTEETSQSPTTTTVATDDSDNKNETSATTTVSPDATNMTVTTTTSPANDTSVTTTMSSNGAAFRTDINGTQGQDDESGFDEESQNETTQEKTKPANKGIKGLTPAPTPSQTSQNPDDIDTIVPVITNAGVKGGTKGGASLISASSVKSGKKFRSPSAAARLRLNRVKKEDRSSVTSSSSSSSPSDGSRRRRKISRDGSSRRRNRNSSRVRVNNKRRRISSSSNNSRRRNSQSSSRQSARLPEYHDPGYSDIPFRTASSQSQRTYARPPQRFFSYSTNHANYRVIG